MLLRDSYVTSDPLELLAPPPPLPLTADGAGTGNGAVASLTAVGDGGSVMESVAAALPAGVVEAVAVGAGAVEIPAGGTGGPFGSMRSASDRSCGSFTPARCSSGVSGKHKPECKWRGGVVANTPNARRSVSSKQSRTYESNTDFN